MPPQTMGGSPGRRAAADDLLMVGRPKRALRVVVSLVIVVGLVGLLGGTWALYSDTTINSGDAFAAGTVAISDDDAGTSMFTVTNQGAGATGAKCIKVTYTGTLPADVRLTATASGGALAPYLSLAVIDGVGGSSATCAAFQARSISYAGSISAFPTSYAAGAPGAFAPTITNQARTYRIVYTIDPAAPLATMNTSANINLQWEARNATPQPLQSWGANASGQLGLGDTTQRTSPTQVGTDTDWATIAAGYSHSCATKANGTLYCWGLNTNGQLGLGDTTQRTTPVQVGTDTDWATIAAGNGHSCATKANGTLYCWGLNTDGQLGLGDTAQRTTPVQVGSDTNWATVTTGYSHSCATKTNGTLYCWGLNSLGQLGLGDTTQRTSPTQIGTDTDWATIAPGLTHSCATKATGTLYCWGFNSQGQLGLGDTTQRNSPTQVGTSTDWVTVTIGQNHSCATKTTGTLYCWGQNSTGQLGLGDTTQRTSPTLVGTGYRDTAPGMTLHILALRRPT